MRDNGYQGSNCNAVLLQFTIVSALTLLFLTERGITHVLAHLPCRQSCRIILLGAGIANQESIVRLPFLADHGQDVFVSKLFIAVGLDVRFDYFLASALEVDKMGPKKRDLSIFWSGLQKSTK